MVKQNVDKIIAVSIQDAELFGCPYCGDVRGHSNFCGGGAQLWCCSGCGKNSIFLSEGVKESPFSCNNQTPTLEPHPRRHLGPIDRKKIIEDHKRNDEAEAIADLQKWISLGYGQPVTVSKVGSHTSKSCHLPIVATDGLGNVQVTWFAYNWYDYFLGIKAVKPIPAIVLYPISSIFGDYASSGHVNRQVAPPVHNFQKEYQNNASVKRFGSFTGSYGIESALVIRYLEEVSKLDLDAIVDVCLNATNYGRMKVIDGNAICFEKLAGLLGLSDKKNVTFDFKLENLPSDIFEKMEIDWFDTTLGESSVKITLSKDIYLPQMPLPAEIYVDLKDTALDQYIPREVQERPVTDISSLYLISKIPVKLLNYRERKQMSSEEYKKLSSENVCGIHRCVNPGVREFTFNTPTVLDCAMTAFFFIKVVAPIIRQISNK